MAAYLLDTNIISPILKKQGDDSERIKSKLKSILRENSDILISPIVYYELARWLHHRKAQKQLDFLENFIACHKWCDLKKDTWNIAAKLWAGCRRKSPPTPTGEGLDKDVLIAAQAKEHNAIVVTNNIRHFQYLGVNHVSW